MASVRRMTLSARRYVDSHHPVLRQTPPSLRAAVYGRLAVSHENKYVYIRVPKAANSTISRTLAWLTYPGMRAEIEDDDRGRTAKHLFSKYPWHWLKAGGPRDYFKFVFVRNPYTRLLSAYLDKVNPGLGRRGQRSIGSYAVGRPSDINFAEFVSHLESGGLHENIHWAPQSDICPLPVVDLDFIGKVESIDDDLEYISQKIFNMPIGLSQQRNSGRTNSAEKAKSQYTPELLERVAKLYDRDFELFGYDRNTLEASA